MVVVQCEGFCGLAFGLGGLNAVYGVILRVVAGGDGEEANSAAAEVAAYRSLILSLLFIYLFFLREEAHGLVTRGTCSLVSDGAIRDVTIPSPTLLYSPLVSIQVNSEWSRVGCWCSSILEKRRAEAERIRENYPDRIPVCRRRNDILLQATIMVLMISFKRFYEHGGEMQVAQDAPLKPSMDIFAVG
ncbi:hypothetical protein Patl1_18690 [Pistacia atlantica]|uniref:Uncharacterized protein n=1 Tax=Pistacia atlantica TaxID=434234 RepID=A0ACC1C1K3_9ROSI|nr:hypothetical protein Patl1_18690 [Pistacia atlantica]